MIQKPNSKYNITNQQMGTGRGIFKVTKQTLRGKRTKNTLYVM